MAKELIIVQYVFNYLILMLIIAFPVFQVRADSVKIEPILPLLADQDLDLKLVALGDRLFYDKRLSQDNSLSCADCHQLSTGGTDRKARSVGVGGALGLIKAPTVYNSGLNFVQFWDGRAISLESQVAAPVHNPLEMSSSWSECISKLKRDTSMVALFNELFEDGITGKNISSAIATFERSLLLVNAPFDRWLMGEDDALDKQALRGYRLFKSYGCISCHQGKNVGGNMYAHMGAMRNYFNDRQGKITSADYGRFNVTHKEEDKHYFKVPSLRLAAVNFPYFHDGSVTTLKEAVRVMGRYQLGRETNI
ncbi:MAG: cytochrome c peroxidase [Candidatus Thiodiazotropha sp.]